MCLGWPLRCKRPVAMGSVTNKKHAHDRPLQAWVWLHAQALLSCRVSGGQSRRGTKVSQSTFIHLALRERHSALRERHLDYWTPYSDIHPRESNSKRSTYHQWCALPTRRAMVTHSPYTLPKYMLLNLPRDIIRSVARFRLRAHTLRIETVTWTHICLPYL